MHIFSPGWYLLYTRPKQEKKVIQQLADLNIQHFLPTLKRLRQWHDRKKIIHEPLFPSYAFVYLNNVREYLAGQDISGVVSYVRFGKEPARIDDKVIANIHLIINECEDVDVLFDYFDEGQQLVINKGPLAGLSCEMIQYRGKSKALVRVELLKRSIVADIPTIYLAATTIF